MALRESKRIDLYFNGFRVFSSNQTYSIEDIDLSFDTLYVKATNGEIRSIDMKFAARISLENSEKERHINF